MRHTKRRIWSVSFNYEMAHLQIKIIPSCSTYPGIILPGVILLLKFLKIRRGEGGFENIELLFLKII